MRWLKQDGEWVNRDEVIAELESEKATFEINAEKAGALRQIAKEGDTLAIGDVGAVLIRMRLNRKIQHTCSTGREKAVTPAQQETPKSEPVCRKGPRR